MDMGYDEVILCPDVDFAAAYYDGTNPPNYREAGQPGGARLAPGHEFLQIINFCIIQANALGIPVSWNAAHNGETHCAWLARRRVSNGFDGHVVAASNSADSDNYVYARQQVVGLRRRPWAIATRGVAHIDRDVDFWAPLGIHNYQVFAFFGAMSLSTEDRKRGHPSRLRGGPASHPCMMNHLRSKTNIPLGILYKTDLVRNAVLPALVFISRHYVCPHGGVDIPSKLHNLGVAAFPAAQFTAGMTAVQRQMCNTINALYHSLPPADRAEFDACYAYEHSCIMP